MIDRITASALIEIPGITAVWAQVGGEITSGSLKTFRLTSERLRDHLPADSRVGGGDSCRLPGRWRLQEGDDGVCSVTSLWPAAVSVCGGN